MDLLDALHDEGQLDGLPAPPPVAALAEGQHAAQAPGDSRPRGQEVGQVVQQLPGEEARRPTMTWVTVELRVSINRMCPGEKLPRGDKRHYHYHGGFRAETHTPESLFQEVRRGHAFCPELLPGDCGLAHHGRWCSSNPKRRSYCPDADTPGHCGRPNRYRVAEHFKSGQHLALDVDSGNLSIDDLLADPFIAQQATMIYPTISSAPDDQRWRVVFVLQDSTICPGFSPLGDFFRGSARSAAAPTPACRYSSTSRPTPAKAVLSSFSPPAYSTPRRLRRRLMLLLLGDSLLPSLTFAYPRIRGKDKHWTHWRGHDKGCEQRRNANADDPAPGSIRVPPRISRCNNSSPSAVDYSGIRC